MEKEQERELFEDLKPYIGKTVQILRRARGMSKKLLAKMLVVHRWQEATEQLVLSIEEERYELSFEEFAFISGVFGISMEKMFECAHIVKVESEKEG